MNNQIRLETVAELRKSVIVAGGNDEDLILFLEENPNFFQGIGEQIIKAVRIIRGDRDCFYFTDSDIVIHIPALKCPTLEEVQNDMGWIKKIECDDSPEKPVTLRLATVLKSNESRIDDATYERRITKLRADGNLLGFQHEQWLIKHQDDANAIPDKKARAALKDLLGKAYIDFPAIIVMDTGGGRYFPRACQFGWWWGRDWESTSRDLCSVGRIAVSSPPTAKPLGEAS